MPIRATDEVWEVGVLALPMRVPTGGAGEDTRPVMAVCASNRGGATSSDPMLLRDLPRSALLEALARFALDAHVPGAPALGYLPKVVHLPTAEGEIAEEFGAAMKELGVSVEVKSELPVLGDFAAFLSQQLSGMLDPLGSEPAPAPGVMTGKGVTVERVRAFAEAAAEFFGARPWERFGSEVLWRVEPKPRTAPLSHFTLMGGAGETYGLGFLSSAADMTRMSELDDPSEFIMSNTRTLWSIIFGALDELPEADAALWEEESLPAAGDEGYPLAAGITPTGRVQRPTKEQLSYLEAVLRAAARLTPEIVREGGTEFEVATFDGPRVIKLRVAMSMPDFLEPGD